MAGVVRKTILDLRYIYCSLLRQSISMCEQDRNGDRNSADKVNANYRYHEMPPGPPLPWPVPRWGEKVLGQMPAAVVGFRSHCSTWARFPRGAVLGAGRTQHLVVASRPSTEPIAPPAQEREQLGAAGAVGMALEVARGVSPGPANKHSLFDFSLLSHGAVAFEVSIRRNERLERSLPVSSTGCRKPRPGQVWHTLPVPAAAAAGPRAKAAIGAPSTQRAQGLPSALRGHAPAASLDLNPEVVCASDAGSVQRRGS